MDVLEELTKEVYAQFGLAYYHSEVLHRGLCCIYALQTFQKSEDITRPRIEEKLARAFSLTLGQVIEETKKLLPSELHDRLEAALEKRNYLAHHLWFERIHLMSDEQGLLELCQELLELGDLFSKLDHDITEYFKPKREAFGITDELIEQQMNNLLAGKLEEPLISQRPPKKQERIVRVWEAKVADNQFTQIFEGDDGCLWQFCDVGLGWTRFKKPAPEWKVNEVIQKYLPANVNPRPPISVPWNFEFSLSKGATLWVKRGKKERGYTWGIKVSQRRKSA